MNISKIVLTTTFAILFVVSNLNAREWTATSGHKLTGDFVELKDGTVSIKLPDGKIADVPLDKLCEADKEFVKQESEKKNNPFAIRDDKPALQKRPENLAVYKSPFGKDTPLETLRTEAEKNNPDAMCWLSIFYARGLNVCNIDTQKAAEWCAKASSLADTGNAAAQFCRGTYITLGEGDAEKKLEEAAKWFQKSADQGFVPAQASLGLLLNTRYKETGQGVDGLELLHKAAEQNYAPAFVFLAMAGETPEQWYRKAADAGDAAALIFCGTIYYLNGDEKEKSEAEVWIRKAAQIGCVELPKMLGDIYREGKDVAPDMAESKKWYRLAVEHGSQKAKTILNDESNFREEKMEQSPTEIAKQENPFVIQDDEPAQATAQTPPAAQDDQSTNTRFVFPKYNWKTPLNELQAAAEKGNAEACWELHKRYGMGAGFCPQNEDKAKEWLIKGAKEDSPAGWTCLLKCHIERTGVSVQNLETMQNLIEKIVSAMYAQGVLYFGTGLYSSENKEDHKKAFNIALELAEMGDAEAQTFLSGFYSEGKGTTEDKANSFESIKKAAEQGYSVAQTMLGACYIEGYFVAKDAKKGFEWHKKAAEQGYLPAAVVVAACYIDGDAVEKDLEIAKQWAEKVIELGAEEDGQLILRWIKESAQPQDTSVLQIRTGANFVGISQDGNWLFTSVENGITGTRLNNPQVCMKPGSPCSKSVKL